MKLIENNSKLHNWKYNIFINSTVISLAFIMVVHLILGFIINDTIRYLIIFTISFLFSIAMFYIIYKQQNELRADREQLITLFNHISDGIMILDDEKNVIEMNEAAEELLDGNNISNYFCDICHDSHGQLKICEYESCFINQKRSYYELQLLNKRGIKIPVSVSTSTYLGAEQKPLTIVSIRKLGDYQKVERSRIQNMVTTSIIKAQEDERKRLSRELHDGIGQSIFSVLLGLEYLVPMLDKDELINYADNIRKTTKQTLEEIRHMAVELRPSVLDDLGLTAALKSYIKTYGNTFGIQINFEYIGDKERLPSNMETALYRISQEALTNVAKYADTDRVDITMYKSDNEFILKINDFGKGFSLGDVRNKEKGVGLYGMEERASMLDGSFNISSEIGIGTEIEVRIPLEKGVEDLD